MGELTWGTPLFFDLWAAGMAGGAYFVAFLVNLLIGDKEDRLLKLSTYIGVPLVLLGVVAIIVDLGEPFRAWHMYIGLRPFLWKVLPGVGAASYRAWPPSLVLYPGSPMSLGGWVLVIFSVCGVALIALWLLESAKSIGKLGGVIKLLTWVAFVFATLVMAYTGVVLSVSSMELWSTTFLLTPLFVASATGTGVGALLIGVRLTRPKESELMAQLRIVLVVLVLVQLALLAGFLIWLSVAGVVGPLISGSLALYFWIGAVLVGLLLPLALEFGSLKGKAKSLGAAVLVSPILVLLGAFALRATVIIGGQI